MRDFCEQHRVQDAQFQTPLCFGRTGTSQIIPAESYEIELIFLNIPRVSWIAFTPGLALSLYQNYEGHHGWVFTDNTFLKPDNIAYEKSFMEQDCGINPAVSSSGVPCQDVWRGMSLYGSSEKALSHSN